MVSMIVKALHITDFKNGITKCQQLKAMDFRNQDKQRALTCGKVNRNLGVLMPLFGSFEFAIIAYRCTSFRPVMSCQMILFIERQIGEMNPYATDLVTVLTLSSRFSQIARRDPIAHDVKFII